MEFNSLKKMLLKKGLDEGFSECEVYYKEEESLSIGIYEGEVEKYQLEKSKGVSFRGKINSKMGYSFTEILDFEAINMVIKNAKQSALNIDSDDEEFIYKGDSNYNKVDTYSEKLENIDIKELINLGIEIEKETKNYSDKVVNISGFKISYKTSKCSIYNTKGLELDKKSNMLMLFIVPVVEENENREDAFGYSIVTNIYDINPKKIAKDVVEKELEKLNATTVKSGKYKVIIENEAMASLLSTFSSVFSSQKAQKGMSLLKDKEGMKIASDVLSIVDNPLLKGGLASTTFDDEGVSCYKKEVVSSGVLNTLLYNLKTANNENKKSTGNGFKSSYKSYVDVECSNLYIENGESSLNDLINEAEEGIIITQFSGLHAGANAITGDFSLAAKGFLISNSKKSHPIEQITASGNYFDLLKDIEKVGNDLIFPLSNVGSPSVLVRELSIAGE